MMTGNKIVLALSCILLLIIKFANAARYNVVGSKDEQQVCADSFFPSPFNPQPHVVNLTILFYSSSSNPNPFYSISA